MSSASAGATWASCSTISSSKARKHRTKVDKSCDCANAPPKSAALKSYLDKILVSQPPGTPCAVCKLTTIEVQLSNIEGNVLTVKKVVDPVKYLFDESKSIKIKGSEQGSIARGPTVRGPIVRGPAVRGPIHRGPISLESAPPCRRRGIHRGTRGSNHTNYFSPPVFA